MKIAIIDDDDQLAETSKWEVEGAGFESIVIKNGYFDNISSLVDEVVNTAQGAICDHRLSPKGFGNFWGSEVVSRLYDEKVPALLVTQFFQDTDVSIRKYRRKIPVLLRRDMTHKYEIKKGITYCIDELNGLYSQERKPVRTMFEVAGITEEAGEEVCDVFIPGWNPQLSIRFPINIVPTELRSEISPGSWMIASVNIGAKSAEDIFLSDFEHTPEVAKDF